MVRKFSPKDGLTETQKINDVPTAYATLRDVAADCIQHIRFDDDARVVFETERVRTQLKSVMDLVIEALGLIAQYFAKPMISTLLS